MRHMNSIISAHNGFILNPVKTNYSCDCRDNTNFPLQNKCLTPSIVFLADVFSYVDIGERVYLGLSETPFNYRYSNHVRDGNHERYSETIELSNHVCELKRNNEIPIITLEITRNIYGNPKQSLLEKFLIIKFPNQDILLNPFALCTPLSG